MWSFAPFLGLIAKSQLVQLPLLAQKDRLLEESVTFKLNYTIGWSGRMVWFALTSLSRKSSPAQPHKRSALLVAFFIINQSIMLAHNRTPQ
jgi:hypothetical protein